MIMFNNENGYSLADIAAATNKYDAQQKLENTQFLNQLKQYGAKKN